MTSNASPAPTAAWLAQGAEQIRERGLSKLAAQILTSAAKRGLKVEWAPDGRQYATIHRTKGYESHYLQVVWNDQRTYVMLAKTGSRPWRNGHYHKKISGREAAVWMTVLEGP
jgi:hypothetical protein